MSPRISILCPTRGRPASVRRLIESVRDTAAGEVELIFYCDDDDPYFEATLAAGDGEACQFLLGPRVVLSECWNVCSKHAKADVLMHCGDDIVFRTTGWDDLILAEFAKVPDRILLVHGDDGIQAGHVATHGFLHRRWMETVGYFVPPIFASDWNDMWLTEVANALGRRVYLPHVYTEHMHPVAGKGEWDQTHQERLVRHHAEQVDNLYRTTGEKRAEDAAKLQAVIDGWQ